MSFAVGSLVRARGREWVVLPESRGELLVLRPLGGTDDEVTGIYQPLEQVRPASFALPDSETPGDERSGRLLRDAVRLGFRSSAGPFRCVAGIAVEPRPYQLVPLLMALKLDPVRLLIADDVGVGKTIEAALIARELLDRGEVTRLAILCPPHLTDQWQTELESKFRLRAEQVLPGTVARLERDCGPGQSLFELYPYVIVSTDFIKSERRRDDFLRHCPELVIVDEAHSCVAAGDERGGRHQRHQLVQRLAAERQRHLVLVTAVPHSGKEEAFRALLALLDPAFADLPDDLSGEANRPQRERLAAHLVQRRRANIEHYMQAETPFPTRQAQEITYRLAPAYRALFEEALDYARERVGSGLDGSHRQRLRWWSVLALLRALASSPAAAAETLRHRLENAGAEEEELELEAVDALPGAMLDAVDEGAPEGLDVVPATTLTVESGADAAHRRRLAAMARQAAALQGAQDAKLQGVVSVVQDLLREGRQPILFCRFIPTAEYVAAELRRRVARDVVVEAVTSTLPAAEREERVLALAQQPRRVLVCTDCLSEGLNLQEHFDTVLHYDLSWNPTRHEQREGRVDRYGQPRQSVRIITYYGADNQIDGIVLEVLIKKSETIRNSLGISVPVPADAAQVVQAIFEGLRLRSRPTAAPHQLELFPELRVEEQIAELHARWQSSAERERRSRHLFAQEAIRPEEVAREIAAVRAAIGAGVDVEGFTVEALRALRAAVQRNGHLRVDLSETPRALQEALGVPPVFEAGFTLPVREGVLYLQRTHPLVEGLAGYVMDTALDPLSRDPAACRAGVIVTDAVERRTTLLLLRLRYHIILRRGETERPLLAEEALLLAFAGAPRNAEWLPAERAEALLRARPSGDLYEERKREYLRRVVEGFDELRPALEQAARERGQALLEAHRRVRDAARARGSYRVEPQLPPDVLGMYVYVPA